MGFYDLNTVVKHCHKHLIFIEVYKMWNFALENHILLKISYVYNIVYNIYLKKAKFSSLSKNKWFIKRFLDKHLSAYFSFVKMF